MADEKDIVPGQNNPIPDISELSESIGRLNKGISDLSDNFKELIGSIRGLRTRLLRQEELFENLTYTLMQTQGGGIGGTGRKDPRQALAEEWAKSLTRAQRSIAAEMAGQAAGIGAEAAGLEVPYNEQLAELQGEAAGRRMGAEFSSEVNKSGLGFTKQAPSVADLISMQTPTRNPMFAGLLVPELARQMDLQSLVFARGALTFTGAMSQGAMMALSMPLQFAMFGPLLEPIHQIAAGMDTLRSQVYGFMPLGTAAEQILQALSVPPLMRYEEVYQGQILLASTLGGLAQADKVMRQALEFARQYPLQFTDILQAFRSLSVYPTVKPVIDQPDFQEKLLNVVSGLALINPMQGLRGALFSIVEALSGSQRSLQMRFNISPELIAQLAQMSKAEMSADPVALIEGLNRFIEKSVGTNVLERARYTFTKQIENFEDALAIASKNVFEYAQIYPGVVRAALAFQTSFAAMSQSPGVGAMIRNLFAPATEALDEAVARFIGISPGTLRALPMGQLEAIIEGAFANVSPEEQGKRVERFINDLINTFGVFKEQAQTILAPIRNIAYSMFSEIGKYSAEILGQSAVAVIQGLISNPVALMQFAGAFGMAMMPVAAGMRLGMIAVDRFIRFRLMRESIQDAIAAYQYSQGIRKDPIKEIDEMTQKAVRSYIQQIQGISIAPKALDEVITDSRKAIRQRIEQASRSFFLQAGLIGTIGKVEGAAFPGQGGGGGGGGLPRPLERFRPFISPPVQQLARNQETLLRITESLQGAPFAQFGRHINTLLTSGLVYNPDVARMLNEIINQASRQQDTPQFRRQLSRYLQQLASGASDPTVVDSLNRAISAMERNLRYVTRPTGVQWTRADFANWLFNAGLLDLQRQFGSYLGAAIAIEGLIDNRAFRLMRFERGQLDRVQSKGISSLNEQYSKNIQEAFNNFINTFEDSVRNAASKIENFGKNYFAGPSRDAFRLINRSIERMIANRVEFESAVNSVFETINNITTTVDEAFKNVKVDDEKELAKLRKDFGKALTENIFPALEAREILKARDTDISRAVAEIINTNINNALEEAKKSSGNIENLSKEQGKHAQNAAGAALALENLIDEIKKQENLTEEQKKALDKIKENTQRTLDSLKQNNASLAAVANELAIAGSRMRLAFSEAGRFVTQEMIDDAIKREQQRVTVKQIRTAGYTIEEFESGLARRQLAERRVLERAEAQKYIAPGIATAIGDEFSKRIGSAFISGRIGILSDLMMRGVSAFALNWAQGGIMNLLNRVMFAQMGLQFASAIPGIGDYINRMSFQNQLLISAGIGAASMFFSGQQGINILSRLSQQLSTGILGRFLVPGGVLSGLGGFAKAAAPFVTLAAYGALGYFGYQTFREVTGLAESGIELTKSFNEANKSITQIASSLNLIGQTRASEEFIRLSAAISRAEIASRREIDNIERNRGVATIIGALIGGAIGFAFGNFAGAAIGAAVGAGIARTIFPSGDEEAKILQGQLQIITSLGNEFLRLSQAIQQYESNPMVSSAAISALRRQRENIRRQLQFETAILSELRNIPQDTEGALAVEYFEGFRFSMLNYNLETAIKELESGERRFIDRETSQELAASFNAFLIRTLSQDTEDLSQTQADERVKIQGRSMTVAEASARQLRNILASSNRSIVKQSANRYLEFIRRVSPEEFAEGIDTQGLIENIVMARELQLRGIITGDRELVDLGAQIEQELKLRLKETPEGRRLLERATGKNIDKYGFDALQDELLDKAVNEQIRTVRTILGDDRKRERLLSTLRRNIRSAEIIGREGITPGGQILDNEQINKINESIKNIRRILQKIDRGERITNDDIKALLELEKTFRALGFSDVDSLLGSINRELKELGDITPFAPIGFVDNKFEELTRRLQTQRKILLDRLQFQQEQLQQATTPEERQRIETQIETTQKQLAQIRAAEFELIKTAQIQSLMDTGLGGQLISPMAPDWRLLREFTPVQDLPRLEAIGKKIQEASKEVDLNIKDRMMLLQKLSPILPLRYLLEEQEKIADEYMKLLERDPREALNMFIGENQSSAYKDQSINLRTQATAESIMTTEPTTKDFINIDLQNVEGTTNALGLNLKTEYCNPAGEISTQQQLCELPIAEGQTESPLASFKKAMGFTTEVLKNIAAAFFPPLSVAKIFENQTDVNALNIDFIGAEFGEKPTEIDVSEISKDIDVIKAKTEDSVSVSVYQTPDDQIYEIQGFMSA